LHPCGNLHVSFTSSQPESKCIYLQRFQHFCES
jgi:hypothetical protein